MLLRCFFNITALLRIMRTHASGNKRYSKETKKPTKVKTVDIVVSRDGDYSFEKF